MQPNDTPMKGRGPVLRSCDLCGDPYRVHQYRLDIGRGRFCSNQCRGRNSPRQPGTRVAVVCTTCNAPLYRRPSQLNPRSEYFCNQTCSAKKRAERKSADPHLRFSRQCAVRETGCIEWLGKPGSHGYGSIGVNGQDVLAHRYAWELTTGETLTSRDDICHTCDNRLCVKNDEEGFYSVGGVVLPRRGHLFKATHAINNADMTEKGRHGKSTARGRQIRAAKLTEEAVRAIRAAKSAGAKGRDLAVQHGVSAAVISEVVTRKTWRHVS